MSDKYSDAFPSKFLIRRLPTDSVVDLTNEIGVCCPCEEIYFHICWIKELRRGKKKEEEKEEKGLFNLK